jgi:dynein heavy chain
LELWGFFVARTRANLHLLLALSPAGAAFRERLRANPSLVNCCTIDWFWQVGRGIEWGNWAVWMQQ